MGLLKFPLRDWSLLLIILTTTSSVQSRSFFHGAYNTASSFLSSLSNLPCSIPVFCSQNPQPTEPISYPQTPQYQQVPQFSQNPQYPIYQNQVPDTQLQEKIPQTPISYPNQVPDSQFQENVPQSPVNYPNQLPDSQIQENFPQNTGNSPDTQYQPNPESALPLSAQQLPEIPVPEVPDKQQIGEQPVENQLQITCPRNGQHYPVYDDCKKYFICVDGFLTEITCPKGLYYNCMTQTCETQTLHLCCKNDKKTAESVFTIPNHSYYPCREGAVNGYDSKNVAKCIDDKIYSASCDNNNEFCMDSLQCFDSTAQSCDENATGTPYEPTESVPGIDTGVEPMETCPSGKKNFEIKDNCGAYYNCSSGEPHLYTCPEGYFYDCWNEVCSRTTSVYCCYNDERYTQRSGTTDLIDWEKREYVCKENMKVAFEITGFKEYYAICSGNLLYHGSCFPNSYCNLTNACYDPKVERCVSSVASKYSATTKSPSLIGSTRVPLLEIPTVSKTTAALVTSTEGTVVYSSDSAPLPAEEEMVFPATQVTTEAPMVQAPAGTIHINPIATDQCFDKFSTLAVYKDCSKYVIYNSSIPTTYACPGTQKFDGFKKCCVKEHTAFTSACGGDPNKSFINHASCSDADIQNVEHPTKCNMYFTCDSFQTISEQTCPSGEVFDWQKKGCVDEGSAVTVPNCSSIH